MQGLPGVGPARVQRLLAHCGRVAAAVGEAAGELALVPGIGNHRGGHPPEVCEAAAAQGITGDIGRPADG